MSEFRVRADIAPEVIHFTKGKSGRAAFDIFRKIVNERRLLGGIGYIRGGYRCACFTEAPLGQLAEVFWMSKSEENWRYMPFGVLARKRWLFAKGGRPVIYQAAAEYDLLPEKLRYRHVTYEPAVTKPIDFTWEREWRIHADELPLDPSEVQLVVVGAEHLAELQDDHEQEQDLREQAHALAVGAIQAGQMRETFPWQVIVLDNLRPDWHYSDGPPPGWGLPEMGATD